MVNHKLFYSSVSCTLNKGLGGTLVSLKGKILKEYRDFQIWRRNILAKADGHETWNTEKISEQGGWIFLLSLS